MPDVFRLLAAPSLAVLLGACSPGSFPQPQRGALDAAVPDADGSAEDAVTPEEDATLPEPTDSEAFPDVDDTTDASTSDNDAAGDSGEDPAWPTTCTPASAARPLVLRDTTTAEVLRITRPADVDVEVLGPVIALSTRKLWTFASTRLSAGKTPPGNSALNYPSAAFQALDVGAPFLPAWGLDRRLTVRDEPGTVIPLVDGESSGSTTLRAVDIVAGSRDAGPEAWALVISQPFGASTYDAWMAATVDGEPPITRQGVPAFGQMYGDYYLPMAAWHGVETATENRDIYVFACSPTAQTNGFRVPCIVARAASSAADQRTAYTAYVRDADGQGSWDPDLTKATPVFSGSTVMLSVSFNVHIGQFVALYGELYSNTVVLQTANSPEGPWTRATSFNLPASQTAGSHPAFVREQAALSPDCGQHMVLSYIDPSKSENGFPVVGDTVIATLALQ